MKIALVAHDRCKPQLVEWVRNNCDLLLPHQLICTGTTGKQVAEALGPQAQVSCLKSGPLGGDQQLGAQIAAEQLDLLIFLWDPLSAQPHDVDVKALLRLSVLYNLPMACNLASADFLLYAATALPDYQAQKPDFDFYLQRALPEQT